MFQTLNWPQTYPVNVDCEWNIEIPDTTKVIEISFDSTVFGIAGSLPDCPKDWVKVYDGHEVSETSSWGPYCHYRIPDTIKTMSHRAKVHFHAGPAHNPSRRGFRASFVSVDGAYQPPVVQEVPQNPIGELFLIFIISSIHMIYIITKDQAFFPSDPPARSILLLLSFVLDLRSVCVSWFLLG